MSLTVFFDGTKTVAYTQQGKNKFEAVGVWTLDEVKMALRLLRSFPIGSYNRAPGTLQFALALSLARTLEEANQSIKDFGNNEIYRALANGPIVVGKRVSEQPDFVSGVEIVHLDPATAVGTTYELVFDVAAQTLAWQKATFVSANTVAVKDGEFDIPDDTGALFVHVRVRVDELPTEDRTESFTIENVESTDYLARNIINYFADRFPRDTGESDTDYRARGLAFLTEIRVTKWGMADRLRRLLGYVPRIEENREWFEDWFVAGKAAPASEVDGVTADVVTPASVVIKPSAKDATLRDNQPDLNDGTAGTNLVGQDSLGNVKRIVMEFDLSSIPANAILTSATLELYADSTSTGGNADNRTHNIHRITQGWTESPVAQVVDLVPGDVEIDDEFKVILDDSTTQETFSFKATAPTVLNVTAGLTAALAASTIVSAVDNTTKVTITSLAAGVPFTFITTTINAAGGQDTQTFTGAITTASGLGATWNNQAADFDSAVLGTIATGLATAIGVYKISTDVHAVVDQWLRGEKSNFGLMLRDSDEATSGTFWRYVSDEGIAAQQPILRVSYVTVTPGVQTTDPALLTALVGSIDTMLSGNSSVNYFLNVRVKAADVADQDVIDAIAETKPMSRRVHLTSGYGVELVSWDAEDGVAPASGGATFGEAGGTVRFGELVYADSADERADFQFQVPDDYSGEGVNVVIFYRTASQEGRALIEVSERSLVDDDVWDSALVIAREFKARAPFSGSDIREVYAVIDPTWTARDIVQLAVKRSALNPIDTLVGGWKLLHVRLFKRT